MARVLLTLVAAALFNGSSAFMARSPMSRLIHRSTTSDSQARCDVVLGAYNKVFVAGASKGVGRECVQQLLGAGKEVVAMVRTKEAAEDMKGLGATAIVANAFDYKDLENAMDGCDAAVTTLGGVNEDGRRVDYKGNSNVVEAAGILGVTRLVLVTSVGCGDSRVAVSDQVYDVLKDALEEKTKVENQLNKFYKFTTDFTIIRPGGLVTAPATGKAELTADNTLAGVIHRADVAALVVKALDDPSTVKKTFSAIDPTLKSAA